MTGYQATKYGIIYRKGKKTSLAFKYCIFLIVYSLVYYFCYESLSTVLAQGLTFLGFLVSVCIVAFNYNYKSYKTTGIVILMLLSMCVSNIINEAALGSTVTCITMLSGIYVLSKYSLKRGEIKILTVALILMTVFILLNCNIGNQFYEGKFNPNAGGFVLALLFCVLFSRYLISKKLTTLFLSLVCLVLQVVYISRTALLCGILFLVVNILFNTKRKIMRGRTLQKAIILLGVLGVLLAFFYSEVLFNFLGYGKLQIFGKDLFTGRENIWRGAFQSLVKNPIFGVGGELNKEFAAQSGNALVSNAHNQPVGLAVTFGLPVFFAYYYLFSKSIIKANDKINAVVAVFIITIMIMSYFDVYFFAIVNVGPILIAYCIIKNNFNFRKKNDNRIHSDV